MKATKHWKVDRNKWKDEHPYPAGGYASFEQAEAHCREVRKVHTDRFTPIRLESGNWGVEQDVAT